MVLTLEKKIKELPLTLQTEIFQYLEFKDHPSIALLPYCFFKKWFYYHQTEINEKRFLLFLRTLIEKMNSHLRAAVHREEKKDYPNWFKKCTFLMTHEKENKIIILNDEDYVDICLDFLTITKAIKSAKQ